VVAAGQVGRGGQLQGAALGSTELTFHPGTVTAGRYRFAVGSAGSATLVLQTVLPALLTADGPSELVLEGGTHNPMAPPFEFLARGFLPVLERMGVRVAATLERHGFYPAGGGRLAVTVDPASGLRPLELLERGEPRGTHARAVVARLPRHIAERELRRVAEGLGWPAAALEAVEVDSAGPGNVLTLEIASEQVTEVLTGFGERGVRAEAVADRAVKAARRYLEATAPVGEHLADQLLLPCALAGAGVFRTLSPSSHTRTNIEVLGMFLDLEVVTQELGRDDWRLELRRR
jgi:RNA 3'-terminal phosphate cyclase (ATP)